MLSWDEKQKYATLLRFDDAQKKEMGKNLKAAREKTKFSQEDVAELLEKDVRSIRRMEQGSGLTFDIVFFLCQLYGCNMDEVVPPQFTKYLSGSSNLVASMDGGMLLALSEIAKKETTRREKIA